MITYRKTRDEKWVAFGPVSEVRVGNVVVTKRDGASKTETVVSLGKPFLADGRQCVYGYLAPKGTETQSAPAPRRSSYGGGKCRAPGCSAMAVDRGYCKQCAFDEFDD
jgi:hypothetical protein